MKLIDSGTMHICMAINHNVESFLGHKMKLENIQTF